MLQPYNAEDLPMGPVEAVSSGTLRRMLKIPGLHHVRVFPGPDESAGALAAIKRRALHDAEATALRAEERTGKLARVLREVLDHGQMDEDLRQRASSLLERSDNIIPTKEIPHEQDRTY